MGVKSEVGAPNSDRVRDLGRVDEGVGIAIGHEGRPEFQILQNRNLQHQERPEVDPPPHDVKCGEVADKALHTDIWEVEQLPIEIQAKAEDAFLRQEMGIGVVSHDEAIPQRRIIDRTQLDVEWIAPHPPPDVSEHR